MSLENTVRFPYFSNMGSNGNHYPERLVLYDGVCALCNTTVNFLLKVDRKGVLAYAPLQGETAKEIRSEYSQANANEQSVVFMRRGEMGRFDFYHRSDAFITILRELGSGWRLVAGVLRLIPRPIRDRIYDLIAAHRYRWFGKYDSCPLPPPEVRQRFLP